VPEPGKDTAFVMDSSALLAFLNGEPGGALVQRVLKQCSECGTQVEMTSLGLFEAYAAAVTERASSLEELASLIDQLPVSVEPLTPQLAMLSARVLEEQPDLRPSASSAIVLSRQRGATLLTADPVQASMVPSLYVGPRRDAGNPGKTPEFQRDSLIQGGERHGFGV
jgi:PIN domain nuclease of toxin-antitoxin system